MKINESQRRMSDVDYKLIFKWKRVKNKTFVALFFINLLRHLRGIYYFGK